MKFSIITPCFNAEQYIEETICSVVNQSAIVSGRAELEYIICDGGSTDRTVEIAKAVSAQSRSQVKIISEPDAGMYDALSKGLQLASGDICAYINADDLYNLRAFDIVLDLFGQKSVQWLTGYHTIYNDRSYLVYFQLPYRYRRGFIRRGLYAPKQPRADFGRVRLPLIQQESTFWSQALNHLIDHQVLKSFRYAGDFYLWSRFAAVSELTIVAAHLGGYRVRKGQLGENIEGYYKEMMTLFEQPRWLDYPVATIDQLIWHAPFRIKTLLNRSTLFKYNHQSIGWD